MNEDSAGYILKNITCLLKPGRLTLVLGPPGSSKSSFLKALCGNLLHVPGAAKLSGKIEYNGYDIASLKNLASLVSYVDQTDEHQPLLTTRETLEFAWKCLREPIYSKYPVNEKFKAIGGSTMKGVSGGEKRRVTLGEKLVTGTTILALDEITLPHSIL